MNGRESAEGREEGVEEVEGVGLEGGSGGRLDSEGRGGGGGGGEEGFFGR